MTKLKYFALIGVCLLLVALGYMIVTFRPIMSGMAAKTMCTCVYALHRDEESVKKMELAVFPGLSRASFVLNTSDSSVSATLLGKEAKAIFRKGLGCTLLAERSEGEIRNQKIARPLPSATGQDSIDWPAGDLTGDSLLPRSVYHKINEVVDRAFIDPNPASPANTLAVLVVHDGKLIAEKYATGFTKYSPMAGWSMTKSITNALIGILVKDGRLKTDDPAPVKEWQNDERRQITLNNLLQASSGLSWNEIYFLPGDFHNMFIHSDDKASYAERKELEYQPGEHFQYSSGTTNILSGIIRRTVGDEDYYRFPYEKLFSKIGMNHALLEPDASGTFVGSSYGYASARDWARFGMLYLNDGVWMGERILPEGWVKYSTTPATSAKKGEYGAQWWLNVGEKGNPSKRKYPDLPNEVIMADGFEHQHVIIIPSKRLVIVRMGVTHQSNFRLGGLVNGIMAALP